MKPNCFTLKGTPYWAFFSELLELLAKQFVLNEKSGIFSYLKNKNKKVMLRLCTHHSRFSGYTLLWP